MTEPGWSAPPPPPGRQRALQPGSPVGGLPVEFGGPARLLSRRGVLALALFYVGGVDRQPA